MFVAIKQFISPFSNLNNCNSFRPCRFSKKIKRNANFVTILEGIYIESEFRRGRSMSFDTGLEILLSRPRIEAKFMINGTIKTVSSVNKFYEILEPDPLDFAKVQAIYSLPLPNDIKKEINYYVGNRKKLYYRKKRFIPRNNYTSG